MTVLITGGAGYIGSHLVHALAEREETLVVLDDLSTGHSASLPSGMMLIRGDIRDGALVTDVMRAHRVTAVVHFAGDKSVPRSMTAPGQTFSSNVTGTLALLEAMAAARVDRLVFSSTCAVYGTPAALPITEAAQIQPENPYGESKALAERMIRWFNRVHGLRSVILRYFNAAGAHPGGDLGEDWRQAENLMPAVLRAAWTGSPVTIFGQDYPTPDGTAIRDYVHVMDLADAHLRALEYLAGGGVSDTLNLGTGSGTSVRQVVEIAQAVVNRPLDVIHAPRRHGDPVAVWADPSRAAKVLGWTAHRGLRGMVESAWEWHSRHPDGHAGPSELEASHGAAP